ncbi:hypothetical protein ACEZDB_36130 [Streptacidiphilus sp. N1-3]|uniref:Uncharacterized protein n=1 Tax=Streptacidiphilus alkalitolerans TaxID=3342712 RepID=A0ABV6XCR3_9ACTN
MSHSYRTRRRSSRVRRLRVQALDHQARTLLARYCARTGLDQAALPPDYLTEISDLATGTGADLTTWPWSTAADWLAMATTAGPGQQAAPEVSGAQAAAALTHALAEARWHATHDLLRRRR